MNSSAIYKIFIVLLVVSVVGILAGYIYQKKFAKFVTPKSVIISDQTQLDKYLGLDANLSKTFKYKNNDGSTTDVASFDVKYQPEFKNTDDCIAEHPGNPVVFCFDSKVKNGKIIIDVYPNPDGFAASNKGFPEKALNFSIFSILENRLGIDPMAKYTIIDISQDPIFKW